MSTENGYALTSVLDRPQRTIIHENKMITRSASKTAKEFNVASATRSNRSPRVGELKFGSFEDEITSKSTTQAIFNKIDKLSNQIQSLEKIIGLIYEKGAKTSTESASTQTESLTTHGSKNGTTYAKITKSATDANSGAHTSALRRNSNSKQCASSTFSSSPTTRLPTVGNTELRTINAISPDEFPSLRCDVKTRNDNHDVKNDNRSTRLGIHKGDQHDNKNTQKIENRPTQNQRNENENEKKQSLHENSPLNSKMNKSNTQPENHRKESDVRDKKTTKDTRSPQNQRQSTQRRRPTNSNTNRENSNKKQSNKSSIHSNVFAHVPPYVSGTQFSEDFQNFPSAWYIHDSTLKKIDMDRLGYAYCFQNIDICAYRLESIVDVIRQAKSDLEQDPDVIVLHCGINNLKATDPSRVASDYVTVLKNVINILPKSKILISEILPTRDHLLNIKVRLLNALLAETCESLPPVSIIRHSFRATVRSMEDHIHPSAKGASILAGTLGWATRRALWITPHQRPRGGKRSISRSSSTAALQTPYSWQYPYKCWYMADGATVSQSPLIH